MWICRFILVDKEGIRVCSRTSPVIAKESMQIAFVSSCLPRKCGIATFSTHLSQALEKNVGPNAATFIALNNNSSYDYSSHVIYEIEQDNP